MNACFNIREIETRSYRKPIVSLGTFDGVHLGHKAILERLKNKAREKQTQSLVVTYEPHPQSIVSPKDAPLVLTNLEEKLDLLEELDIKETVIIDFNKQFAEYSPEKFIQEMLIDKLDPQGVVIGYNHSFGKNRKGNTDLLKEESEKRGFEIEIVKPVNYKDSPISSTRIRHSLKLNDFEEALNMLGHNYPLYGKVVQGEKKGREIGYPTVNLQVDSRKLLPPDGVYAAESSVNNKKMYGMFYVGTNPTLNKGRSLEIHFFDFEDNIHTGDKLKLYLKKRFRGEEKFGNMQDLKKQLQKDEFEIRNFFKKNQDTGGYLDARQR